MSGVPDKATPLPRLRPELILIEGAPTAMGEPAWLIQDPLQHRYFQIDKPTYHIFSVWSECRTVEELLAQVAVLDEVAVDRDGIARLIEFVLGHKLADPIETGTWKALAREQGADRIRLSPGSRTTTCFSGYPCGNHKCSLKKHCRSSGRPSRGA